MKEKCTEYIGARVPKKHKEMLRILKETYYINTSQFMKNAIEKEYEYRTQSEDWISINK